VAQGNSAALAVDSYLQAGEPESKDAWLSYGTVDLTYDMEDYASAERSVMPTRAAKERVKGFDEIELGFSEQAACAEAKRCLRCDLEQY
jgi:hypothetical protein